MSDTAIRQKLIEEIRSIPSERLPALYDLVHFFRRGLEADREGAGDPMRFAGAWADMAEEDFQGFLREVADRRRKAFSRRRNDG